MNGDIKTRHAMRVGRPRGPERARMRIDFTVPEAKALQRYKLNRGKGATYQTVLVDGLQLLPGFKVILKQEQHKYAKEQATIGTTSKTHIQVEREFGQ